MRSLIPEDQLWGTFGNPSPAPEGCVTERMILRRLTQPGKPDVYLAINALSGAVDILTDKEGRVLESVGSSGNGLASIPEALFRQLARNGYLFASREEEARVYAGIVDCWTDRRIAESDLLAFFSIDTRCSMGCLYCFQRQAESATLPLESSVMTEESTRNAFAALDEIQRQTGRPVKWVILFGGEPLQERFHPVVSQTIALARERNHEVVAFSNLAMIGPNLYRALAEKASDISFIETTLDGPADTHDALRGLASPYQRTVTAIGRLLDAGIPITVRTNVSPATIEQLPRLGRELEERGFYEHTHFKHIVALCTDRHLQGGTIFREDGGYSAFLALRDRHPVLRRTYDYNIVYVLYHLAVSLNLREIIPGVDYRADLSPVVIHCPTGAGSELVFTGAPRTPGEPGYSIYCCAECGSNPAEEKPYRIGTYYPTLQFFPDNCEKWGSRDYLFSERSIRTVKGCYECKMSLLCGGACALESINQNGSAAVPRCREAEEILISFLAAENDRLHTIASRLLS